MEKSFLGWHYVKSRLQKERQPPFFREREVWWCAIGANIGSEEDGKHGHFERPVVVLRRFNNELFWGIPITTKKKYGSYYHEISFHGSKRTAVLWQMRTWSGKRLLRHFGRLSRSEFRRLEFAWLAMIKKTDPSRRNEWSPRVPGGQNV